MVETAMEEMQVLKKIRTCHQCHAPLSESLHAGVASGVGVCPLEHWEGCPGGIEDGVDGHGKPWAGCIRADDLDKSSGSEQVEHDTDDDISDADTEEEDVQEEMHLKKEEIQKLQEAVQQKNFTDTEIAKKERRARRQEQLAHERADLDRQEEILRAQVRGYSCELQAPHVLSSSAQPAKPTGTRTKDLNKKVAEHEARQQRRAAEKLAKRQQMQQQSAGLSMSNIRSLPLVRQEVDSYIGRLKEIAPTLASDQNAGSLFTRTVHRPDVQQRQSESALSALPAKSKFVYVEEIGEVIPVIEKLSDIPADCTKTRQLVESDSECSSDEDCCFDAPTGHRLAWRKSSEGDKYFVVVKMAARSPVLMKSYVLNESTGRYECQLVPGDHSSRVKVTSSKAGKSKSKQIVFNKSVDTTQSLYRDHRAKPGRVVSCVPAMKDERLPSYVHSDSEKQGKESVPELVRYARECPVHWTSKITTPNMNVVLWSWAYIAQILATRIGQAPALQDGELEARLQHFMSVLEVTLQTTVQTDFASDAWKVARLYHTKVQQKLDNGHTDWIQMYEQWGGSTMPHELMAANAEVGPSKRNKKPRADDGGNLGKRNDDRRNDDRSKRLCGSWNKCETRGKCQYEIDNEGEKCKYAHHCSYCKYKKINPVNHQRHFCKKRLEEEE